MSMFAQPGFIPLTDTLSLLVEYQSAATSGLSSYSNIQKVLEGASSRIISEPAVLAGLGEGLARIGSAIGNNPHLATLPRDSFESGLAAQLEKNTQSLKETPPKTVIAKLLSLAAQGDSSQRESVQRAGRLAIRALKGCIASCKDEKGLFDLLATICLSALDDKDPTIEGYTAKILSFSTDILAFKQLQAEMYLMGGISEDDHVLGNFHDVDDVAGYLFKIYIPEVYGNLRQRSKQIPDTTYRKRLKDQRENKPDRLQAILDYDDETVQKRQKGTVFGEITNVKQTLSMGEPFPRNVILTGRPLRIKLCERVVAGEVDESGNTRTVIGLPDGRVYVAIDSPGEEGKMAFGMIGYAYLESRGGLVTNPFSIESTINYLTPYDIPDEAVETLRPIRDSYAQKLQGPSWMILPQGETLLIEQDGWTEAIRFRAMTIELGKGATTKVTLHIGKYDVPFVLDPSHQLRYANGDELSVNERGRVWWETYILAHLKRHLCKDETESTNTFSQRQVPNESSGEKTASDCQRYFCRKLPEHHRYTLHQRQEVLKRTDRTIDIYEYNWRLGRVEWLDESERDSTLPKPLGRVYTWVLMGIEEEEKTQKPPVTYHVPHATDEIQAMLSQFSEGREA